MPTVRRDALLEEARRQAFSHEAAIPVGKDGEHGLDLSLPDQVKELFARQVHRVSPRHSSLKKTFFVSV